MFLLECGAKVVLIARIAKYGRCLSLSILEFLNDNKRIQKLQKAKEA